MEKSPKKARPHYNLGGALASQERLTEAISHYSEALRIKPDYSEARRNLERTLRLMGKSAGPSNTVVGP